MRWLRPFRTLGALALAAAVITVPAQVEAQDDSLVSIDPYAQINFRVVQSDLNFDDDEEIDSSGFAIGGEVGLDFDLGVPGLGFDVAEFYRNDIFGMWLLLLELTVFGLLPASILLNRERRASTPWLVTGGLLTCLGVALNRVVVTLQTQSLPTFSFDSFMLYWPSVGEWAVMLGVVAYGVIVYSISFRYLSLFPRERDLQDIPGGTAS